MVMNIYKRALAILKEKPFRLWGISLLGMLLGGLAGVCFGFVPIIGVAVAALLDVSLTIIFLRGYRGEFVESKMLFEAFRDWKTIKRVLCGMGWMYLWVFLWALIPVVGIVFAIIRAYEYRLTPYILVMEPEVAPTDAIKVSKARTEGWKGRMFGADILAPIAVSVASGILSGIFMRLGGIGGFLNFLLSVVVIVIEIVMPLFLGLVQAAFYEEINASLTAPPPAEQPEPPAPYTPEA